jgi:hypothetical protein
VHADGHAGLDLRGLDIDGQGDEFRHSSGGSGQVLVVRC